MAADFSRPVLDGKARRARAVGSTAICFVFAANGHPPSDSWRSTSARTTVNLTCCAFRTARVLGENSGIVKFSRRVERESRRKAAMKDSIGEKNFRPAYKPGNESEFHDERQLQQWISD